MGRGVDYNRTGRQTDADTCSLTHRKEVGWRCCRKHTSIPQSSASLPKPAQNEATELWKRGKRSADNPTSLRSLYARSPLPPRLPPYIGKKGAVSINFLRTESHYLRSPYVLKSPLYTTNNVHFRRIGSHALMNRLRTGTVFFTTTCMLLRTGEESWIQRPGHAYSSDMATTSSATECGTRLTRRFSGVEILSSWRTRPLPTGSRRRR